MLKGIIFDCDGVLLDTLEANRHFYDAVLAQLGYPRLNDKDLATVHAMTVWEAFNHILSPLDALRAPEVAAALDRSLYFNKVKLPAYLHELLAKLKERYLLGIVTNRDARGIKMLDEFGLLMVFVAVITASDVTKPKPAPEGLLKICRLLSINPDEAVYVGDSYSDMQAARAAGITFVAFANPDLEVDLCVNDMIELEKVIDNIAERSTKQFCQ